MHEPTAKIGALENKYILGGTGFNIGSSASKTRLSDNSRSPPKMPMVVENEQHRSELLSVEQRKMEYAAFLREQMAQKEE